jgi:hypothetical protein
MMKRPKLCTTGNRSVKGFGLALVLVTAACSDDGGAIGRDGGVLTLDGGNCAKPVHAYCGDGGPCPTLATSIEEVKQLAMGARCFKAESGRCGDLSYTFYSSGFLGFMAWFEDGGKLFAARRFADTAEFCGESFYDETYGAQPVCDLEPTALYCPR